VAYYNRAFIEEQRDDLDNAIADATQAIYLDPKDAQAYNTRGFAKLAKGNLDGALADLTQYCDMAPRDHDADHARLYLWLIAKAQNAKADPDQELSDALENSWNSPPDDLISKTAALLLGRMTEADYLAAAPSSEVKTDQAQRCLSWYFVGMKRLLMGDKKGAIDAFHQCLATGQKDFCEYLLAQAELQGLEAPVLPPAPAAIPVAQPVKSP
jgi:tetratricopeptide (TPR) repeat protein